MKQKDIVRFNIALSTRLLCLIPGLLGLVFIGGLLVEVIPPGFKVLQGHGLPSAKASDVSGMVRCLALILFPVWWCWMRAFSWIEITPEELRKSSRLGWTRRVPWASVTSIRFRNETAQIAAGGFGGGAGRAWPWSAKRNMAIVLYRGRVRLPITIPAYYADQGELVEFIRSKCPASG